jgi:hypothetical protein
VNPHDLGKEVQIVESLPPVFEAYMKKYVSHELGELLDFKSAIE